MGAQQEGSVMTNEEIAARIRDTLDNSVIIISQMRALADELEI